MMKDHIPCMFVVYNELCIIYNSMTFGLGYLKGVAWITAFLT